MKWARNQYATMISILGHDNVSITFRQWEHGSIGVPKKFKFFFC